MGWGKTSVLGQIPIESDVNHFQVSLNLKYAHASWFDNPTMILRQLHMKRTNRLWNLDRLDQRTRGDYRFFVSRLIALGLSIEKLRGINCHAF